LHSKFEVGWGESREMEWGGRVGGTHAINNYTYYNYTTVNCFDA